MKQRSKKRTMCAWVAGAVLIVLVLLLVYFRPWYINLSGNPWHQRYTSYYGYFHDLGFPGIPTDYANVLAAHGEPIRIEKGVDEIGGMPYFIAYYDTIVVECVAKTVYKNGETIVLDDTPIEEYRAVAVKILPSGTDYRFGRAKIGIGSSRKWVEWFYQHNIRINLSDTPLAGYEEYYDAGGLYVAFHYDGDDRVDEIEICPESVTTSRMQLQLTESESGLRIGPLSAGASHAYNAQGQARTAPGHRQGYFDTGGAPEVY